MNTLAKQRQKTSKSTSAKQKRILMLGLGGGVVAGLGYLAYSFFRNKASMVNNFPFPDGTNDTMPNTGSSPFPIKRGARGLLVTRIQNALLTKGGPAALIIKETSFKNGQVDGVFGKGTERALRAAGFASALTALQFNALVGKTADTSNFNASGISKTIQTATNTKNLFGVLNGLQKIRTATQYKMVSAFFQGIRISGIRVTSLVNALLSVAFANKDLEKTKIRAEFIRMGLKQNARGIWFIPNLLGAIGSFDRTSDQIAQEWSVAITAKPTFLRADDGVIILPELQPDTVIGYIIGIENGKTRILTQSGEVVFAPSKHLFTL